MRSMRIALFASMVVLPTFVVPTAALPTTSGDVAGESSQQTTAVEGATAAQPNFVVIVTDDQKWDTVGRCSPELDPFDFDAGTDACMPNLQDLVMDSGTTFLKGQVTQSLCCPSRASILTGQYSTTHGVTNNNGGLFDDSSSAATWLDEAGYRTGLFGKYLNGYGLGPLANYIPPGWDYWEAYHGYRNTDDPYTNYPWISWTEGDSAGVVTRIDDTNSTSDEACADGNLYSTDYICNLTIDFLQADTTTPFFTYINPATPHSPYTVADRHVGAFSSINIPHYPSTNVLPSPNPPSYLPVADLRDATLDRIEGTLRSTLALTLTVDDMIGALHAELSADGRLDNTVWIFISDNGISSGEHHWRNKGCEYYTCHQVPFVVVCPTAVCPGAQAGAVDPTSYVLNVDIAPTLAELAGATPTIPVDGMSMVPLLNDSQAAWRTEWFMHGNNPLYEGIVGVGTDGAWYKYVEFPSTAEFELYNVDADPWELTNLAGDAGHAAVQADLAARLAAHLNGEPPANIAPSASFASSCTDLDCGFTDTSTDADGSVVSWDWDFGDGNLSTTQNPLHAYAAAGTYSVSLTVTDNDGAIDTATASVIVTDPGANVGPTASFTSSCTDLDCGFTDTSTDADGSVVSWDWDFGDGNLSTTQNPLHAYAAAGTYTVSLTVTDNDGATDSTTADVTVTKGGGSVVFIETDGLAVFEAEHFSAVVERSGDTWTEATSPAGFSGDGVMVSGPDDGTRLRSSVPTTAPEMSFVVDFTTTGTYYVWLRAWAPDIRGKAMFVGLDGLQANDGIAAGGSANWGDGVLEWTWSNSGRTAVPVVVDVLDPGVHTVQVWMGDDGVIVDKVVMTTDATLAPADLGPPESPTGTMGLSVLVGRPL